MTRDQEEAIKRLLQYKTPNSNLDVCHHPFQVRQGGVVVAHFSTWRGAEIHATAMHRLYYENGIELPLEVVNHTKGDVYPIHGVPLSPRRRRAAAAAVPGVLGRT